MNSFKQVWCRTETPNQASSDQITSLEAPTPIVFPDGLKVWHNCEDATVDICFIHGLSGNRDKTWTAPAKSTPWPYEFLSSRLAKARLLTYGYNAYVVRKSVSSTNRLIDHASNLLHDLTTERASSGATNRSLIFVVHSFGGIVCKAALIMSRQSPEYHLKNVFDCTNGIAFLGTPHRGSWAADWAKIPAWALGQVKSTNRNILDVLQINSQYLEFIQVTFISMLRELRDNGRALHVTCFFEELPISRIGTIVSKESASLEGYSAFSIHANHSDMVKFASPEENGFKRLLGELTRWIALLEDSTVSPVAGLESKEETPNAPPSLHTTTGHVFHTSGGVQHNNTGGGNQFFGNFDGPVYFGTAIPSSSMRIQTLSDLMPNGPKNKEKQTNSKIETRNSGDSQVGDTPVSITSGHQFNISGGTQYNNTGNGNQFLGSQFHGDVKFVGSGEDNETQSREIRRAQVLKRLATSPYRDRKDRNPSAVRGTCEWFISHHLYHQWLGNEASKILWVSADPGCGKSVLVKYLVDLVIQTTESQKVCYFFFKDDFADQRSVLSAMSCLLQQLFMHDNTLLTDDLLLQFDANDKWINGSFAELWQILVNVAENNRSTEIVCLVDAVDECNENERIQFFKALCELYGSKKTPNLKFLITSRPYREIGMGFKPLENLDLPVIHLSGESDAEMRKIVKEIDIAIRERAKRIGVQQKLTSDEQDILITRLLCVRNRTYLWAHLTLDIIERELDINKEKIIDITSHLPQTVNEAYERILRRTYSVEKATRMLHLIIAAKRPLAVGEMIVALALEKHHKSFYELDLEPEDRFRDKIRDICGLVTVSDSRIFLLHQTVKEFLIAVGHANLASSFSQSWKQSVHSGEPNLTLTNICLWCLLLDHPTKNTPDVDPPPSTSSKRNTFINYAAKHWADHFIRLPLHNQKDMANVALEVCDARRPCFLAWFPVYWRSRHSRAALGFTALMAASYFGLEILVKRLLKTDYSHLNRRDETYQRSALSWAAGNGHDRVVKRLIRGISIGPRSLKIVLRRGAKINEFDADNRTPITYAIWNRHLSVVRRLVESGAWVDVPDVLGGTPTSYAVTSGNHQIAALVLRGAVPSDKNDNEGEKLLLSAAKYGHIHVVRVLLEARKTNVNPKDGRGWTPLMWAINYRHIGVIKLLLEHKGDVNIRDKTGMTPLHFATRYGQSEIAKLILKTGRTDVNIPDLSGLTPLHQAARRKQDDIAQLILRTGMANITATVNCKDPAYSWVIRYNSCSTLKLMFDLDWTDKLRIMMSNNKVDITLRDADGDTLLHRAVTKRSYQMIKELLATGKAPINSQNSRGLTPLAQACFILYLEAVSLFIKTDLVYVNIADTNGNTPLHHAIHEASTPITYALIESGKAKITMKNKDGRTPFALACFNGNLGLVKYLLETTKPNINTQDVDGRTPIHNSIWMEDIDIMRLLLQTGQAKLNVVDNFQCTPLLLAAYQNKWHMVHLLLGYKQAVNMKGHKGRSVIFWAIIQGQTEIVELLVSLSQTNINLKDEDELTPLCLAAQLGKQDIIRILLAKPGIDVDAKDKGGMTALGHAAQKGHLGAVESLLDDGRANSWVKDNRGKTPLALASDEGQFNVIQRFLF
ncbi:ankyrin repeat domain protein [Fusarium beomiforme]|uniref:Ankyrin repeat domain protein n=1 Tax=Fusarium beomiforme TaxID=44412 RepID=A0A9P5AK90_9HYPO|nr:ankyrin repeat domain protein [Fusarium beomiforme]